MGFLDSVIGGAATALSPLGAGVGALVGMGGGSSIPNASRIPKLSDIPTNQTVLDLQKQLKDTPAPTPIQGYSAKDMSGPLPEYDLARQRANEQSNSEGQTASEALSRRFASLGGGANSGAFIKQQEIQNQDTQNRRSAALQDINASETKARRDLQQVESQKEFQSGENAKNVNAQQAFQDKVFRFDSASKLGQLDLGYKSAELNAASEAYNAELNSYTAKHSGGLLGAGGILGTGIGA